MSYLSIFSSQVERGPKVVISRMRVHPTLQQHRHHLSITTGTCYVELQRKREREPKINSKIEKLQNLVKTELKIENKPWTGKERDKDRSTHAH